MGYNACNAIFRVQNNKTNIATRRSGCDVERKNKRSGMDAGGPSLWLSPLT